MTLTLSATRFDCTQKCPLVLLSIITIATSAAGISMIVLPALSVVEKGKLIVLIFGGIFSLVGVIGVIFSVFLWIKTSRQGVLRVSETQRLLD